MERFKTRKDIRIWLETQPQDVCVVVSVRAALRVLPISRKLTPTQSRKFIAKFQALTAALYFIMGHKGVEKKTFVRHKRTTTAAANVYAEAAAYSAYADAAAYASAAANAAASTAAANAAADVEEGRKKFFKSILDDATFIESSKSASDLVIQPLWIKKTDLSDMLLNEWKDLSKNLLSLDQDWEVWTDWYDDRLKGTPLNPKLEFGRISFPEQDYKEPAVINAKIKAMLEEERLEAIAKVTPLGEEILLNHDGKFYARSRPIKDIYQDNLSNLQNALDLALKENAFNKTSAVVRVLNDTISKYSSDPQRIHDNCHFALTRIQTLLDADVISESDSIAFLKHVLNLNVIDVRSHDSKVKEVFEKRSNLLLEPDAVDVNKVDTKQSEAVIEAIATEGFFQDIISDILTIKGLDENRKDAIYRILSRFSRMFIHIKQLGLQKTGDAASSVSINETAKVALLKAQPYLQSIIDILRPVLSGI